jgi:hypothetical protein
MSCAARDHAADLERVARTVFTARSKQGAQQRQGGAWVALAVGAGEEARRFVLAQDRGQGAAAGLAQARRAIPAMGAPGVGAGAAE